MTMTIEELTAMLGNFARDRDWEQFHTPKNLAMALAGEAGEVLAELQWLTPLQCQELSEGQREALALELADVLIYLCRLADVTGIDLMDAAERKIAINADRFPTLAGSADPPQSTDATNGTGVTGVTGA
jgi:NTP pyrophosphatase (non-canonical NTP hydrolase)